VQHYQELLAREPDSRSVHAGLAAALFDYAYELRRDGKLDAAVAAFAQAAKFAPDRAVTWVAFGNACMELELATVRTPRVVAGDEDLVAHALAAFSRAAALQAGAPLVVARRAMAARYACAWTQAGQAEADLVRLARERPAEFACDPFSAAALLTDPLMQRRGIEGWCRTELPAPAAPGLVRRRGTRLRLGYLSSDFHDHATAHLAAGLFERHDRARFEVFAYACDRDDGSAMRARLRGAFEHWRDLTGTNDADAAKAMADDALDVLVDLKGHTDGARPGIIARRPAPVQLHYLGFPGTLAYGAIDGIVVDDVVAPRGSEDEFAERLVRLPVCYQVNDDRRQLPPAASRADAGLPADALVIACFNQTYKLTQPFVAAWLDVLHEHGDAVLWLAVPHALARRNLHRFAEAHGVAPERVIFAPMLPQTAHLARLQCADLALDVLPFGSHTTGSDALFAGVPLLTCRGTTFAGRVGASLCRAVDLMELVTESLDEYRGRLRALCADRRRLAHYRMHLRDRGRLALFDTQAFTRAYEDALTACAR
jgi:predicted O-linked N-acetylglucosamine transferase (SPINDLY family)